MDEHRLLAPFKKDFEGRDGANVYDLLNYSLPYLPWYGSLGEMTLSIGSVIHYNKIGCAGAVDIASFACMNEIVAEAVFPKVSKDLKNFPIKVFYFEGTSTNLDRDIEIFLELARNYAQKAKDPH
jgi:predicted nucleotide-binding protein (sugar kinase/HSP70/actin superfamily)